MNDEVPFNGFPYLSSSSADTLHYIVEPGENSLNYYSEFISYEDPVISSSQYTSLEFVPFETTVAVNFDIDLSSHFDFGNDIIILVIEENGNIVDGKTHLDSVCEGVVKAILAALESFVKAVKELASKAFNWIWNMIKDKINSVANGFRQAIKPMLELIIKTYNSMIDSVLGANFHNSILGAFTGPWMDILMVLQIVLMAIYIIITILSSGIGAFIMTLVQNFIVDLIIQLILGAAKYLIPQVPGVTGSPLAIFAKSVLFMFPGASPFIRPHSDFWQDLYYYLGITITVLGIVIPILILAYIMNKKMELKRSAKELEELENTPPGISYVDGDEEKVIVNLIEYIEGNRKIGNLIKMVAGLRGNLHKTGNDVIGAGVALAAGIFGGIFALVTLREPTSFQEWEVMWYLGYAAIASCIVSILIGLLTYNSVLPFVKWASIVGVVISFVALGVIGYWFYSHSVNWAKLAFADVPNYPPSITSVPIKRVQANHLYYYQVIANDPENDKLSYFLDQGPDGMTVDRNSGEIRWTPTRLDIGTHTVTIRVNDGHQSSPLQQYVLTVW